MIYIHDEATGVTVEDGPSGTVQAYSQGGTSLLYTLNDAEADALLRGLLRWKLGASEGTRATPEKADALFEYLSHVVPESVGFWKDALLAVCGVGRSR
jgi:hypothetical protein